MRHARWSREIRVIPHGMSLGVHHMQSHSHKLLAVFDCVPASAAPTDVPPTILRLHIRCSMCSRGIKGDFQQLMHEGMSYYPPLVGPIQVVFWEVQASRAFVFMRQCL